MAAKLSLFFAVAYTIALTILSLVELGDLSVGSFDPTDKMLHSGASFVLALVWQVFYIFRTDSKRDYVRGFIKISLMVIAFGILIEVLQGTLTSFRSPDVADVLANSLGVLVALLICILLQNPLKRLKHKINLFF